MASPNADQTCDRKTPARPSKRPITSESNIWTEKEEDRNLQGKYRVILTIWLDNLDQKSNSYELSVEFHWWVRTGMDNSMNSGRPRLRFPACKCEILEERQFIDSEKSTDSTYLWEGRTTMRVQGRERFEVHDFPLDRQLIDLNKMDFRWMPDEARAAEDPLDVAHLEVHTKSTDPAWHAWEAWAIAMPKTRGSVQVAGRFPIQLRFERNPGYYFHSIFLVSLIILVGSLVPLGMDATMVGDRLSVFSGGMMTLVIFAYGFQEQMPSVSYGTFADRWLMCQIATICAAMLMALHGYWEAGGSEDPERQAWDTSFGLALAVFWGVTYLAHYVLWMARDREITCTPCGVRLFGRRPWSDVKKFQERDPEERTDL